MWRHVPLFKARHPVPHPTLKAENKNLHSTYYIKNKKTCDIAYTFGPLLIFSLCQTDKTNKKEDCMNENL